jgi:hypothetical protein
MTWKVLNTTPGMFSVGHHSLINKQILKVKRGGRGFDLVGAAVAPNTIQVSYFNGIGSLSWHPSLTFAPGEKVYILIN